MWHGIIGHDDVAERFRRTIAAGRLASTYLFVGPAGVGKRRFALELAHALLCTESNEATLEPCGECESCRMFTAGNHPDLYLVSLPEDKSSLPIKLFIGDQEHRNQEGLCHDLGLRPFFGRRKIAIVDDADYFSSESANCLLKTLEEPPPGSLLILIGTSPSRQLPTIRSRSQVIRFQPLETQTVAEILAVSGIVPAGDFANQIAAHSEGSVERARQLADPALWEFRTLVFNSLGAARFDSIRWMRAVQAFIDEAGKEPAQKRGRLRTIMDFALEYFRSQLPREMADADAIVAALDATLTSLEQIDRNANLALVIQSWSEALARSLSPSPSRGNPISAAASR